MPRARKFVRKTFKKGQSAGYGRKLPYVSPRANMKAELKSCDTTLATTIVGSAGTFTLLNGLVAGSRYFERVGGKIAMKSIDIRLQIGPNITSVSTNDDYNRFIIFYDRQCNAAAPSVANLLQDRNAAGTAVSDWFCGINVENRTRFVILFDKTIQGPPVGAATVNASLIAQGKNLWELGSSRVFINLKNLITVYNSSTTGAIADIQEGSLYFFMMGSAAGGTASNLDCAFRARLKYWD